MSTTTIKCIKHKTSGSVYCVDVHTGKITRYKIDGDVDPCNVPPCVISALLTDVTKTIEVEE